MAKKSPFKTMQDDHGSKEKLVDKILEVLERGDADKDELRTRLQTSSNTKLLKLLRSATELREQFGSKEKIVTAILTETGRAKDDDFRRHLLALSPSQLLDMQKAAARRSKAAKAGA